MAKKILLFIFGSAAANIFMMIGVVLLGLAFNFGVIPAEGSFVDPLDATMRLRYAVPDSDHFDNGGLFGDRS